VAEDSPETEQTPQPIPKVGQLNTVQRVRREMVHVYKEMRQGKLPTNQGGRLVFALTCILKTIEVELIEGRLDAVERAVESSGLLTSSPQRRLPRTLDG